MMERNIKLGSLFDGIGAFPYAASLLGIKTAWASEILPHAVSVTRRHFPDMKHVGDITKLDGKKLEPVEIIAFGSPCQDLSQAAGGNRKGLAGERSGLFREAIRVINEMRCATNGRYPRYAIFENVPGCFSSNGRRDYKAVLEAFTESEVPMPKSGRWANAGLVRSKRVNLAWCVYNASDFGLAQRRKRLFLVADFGKGRPESLLLVPKSLPWHFTEGIAERKGIAAAVKSGIGGADDERGVGFDGYNACLTSKQASTLGVNCGMSTGRNGVLTTVSSECAENPDPKVYGICSFASNAMKSDNPHSGIYEAETARTLDLNCGNPACNQGGMAVLAFNGGASPQAGSIGCSDKVSPTLKAASSGLRTRCVAVINDQGGESMNIEKDDCAPTLRCSTHGNLPIVCNLPAIAMRIRAGCEGGGKGALLQTEKSGTLATGNDQYLFCPRAVHPEIVGTLCASGAGLSRPGGMASEPDLTVAHRTFARLRSDIFKECELASTQTARQCKGTADLCVTYCLQGNMIGRSDENGPRGSGVQTDLSFTLTSTDTPAVAAVDCRNFKELGDMSGTLQAKSSAGYSLNYQNPVRMGYIVRRLTPTECERLMGFDDGWTAYGHKDGSGTDGATEISDSRRYSMLGNSIATPCAAYILQGILEEIAKEESA